MLKKGIELLGEQSEFGVDMTMPSRTKAQAWLNSHSFSSLLHYQSYDEASELFYNQSSIGFVLETLPLVGSGEQIQYELSGIFEHLLPEGSNLQILLIASPRIGDWLDNWQLARDGADEVIQELAARRTDYLRQFAFNSIDNSPYIIRTFKVVLSYSQAGNQPSKLEQEQINNIKKQLIATIQSLGLAVKNWLPEDLLRGLDELINLDARLDTPELFWNPHQSLREQVVSQATNMLLDKDTIWQQEGEWGMRNFSVRKFPKVWSLSAMGHLIGDYTRELANIPCPFVIHLGVHICKDKMLKSKIITKSARVEMQAHSLLGKWVPSLVREASEYDFVRQQFDAGHRLVRVQYQVMLFGRRESIEQAEALLLKLYRSNQWELVVDKFLQMPSLISLLPMSFGEGINHEMYYFKKARTTLSHEPANLLPIQGEWLGTQTPGMLFGARRGQLFYWHPFDNNQGNYNVCVVGRSGSGKSVFMQEMVASILGLGGRVFVLDVGRSFERTASLFGGEFLEFNTHCPICINPFSAILDEEVIGDIIAMLKPLISLMAAPTLGTSDMENALIEQAIQEAWLCKKKEAGIDDVIDYLKRSDNQKAKDLATQLYPFGSQGMYGQFFNGHATFNFSKELVVIEFEELKERKDLQSVVVQMVILQITNQMLLGSRDKRFSIIIDEAWDMLRGKQSGQFIETLARRLRKYNGSLVVGTQSVNDFYASAGAQAAFDNSDWMCLLSQKDESIEQLKKSGRLSMECGLEAALKSLKTKQGQYAEVMISGPQGYAIGRLILDPFSKVLYSTKASEYTRVKQLVKQGIPLAQSITKVAEEQYAED